MTDTKGTMLSVRIPRDMLHALLRLARDQDTTVSEVMRAAITAYTTRE